MRTPLLSLLLLLTLPAFIHAAPHVVVTDPVMQTLGGGETLDLGAVGPGQRIEVVIETGTGVNDAITGNEMLWNRLYVNPSTLPQGWESLDSLYYEHKMKAIVIVGKEAADGDYGFSLYTYRDYAGTEPVTFKAKVHVTKAVFDFKVLDSSLQAGVDQPAVYTLKLRNQGSASDAFRIEVAGGLPSTWVYSKEVFVPHNSERDVQYEIAGTDQGEFNVKFKATSLSSTLINGEQTAGLVVRSSLWEDAKAASRGMLLFPSIEQIVYNLLGFIANMVG